MTDKTEPQKPFQLPWPWPKAVDFEPKVQPAWPWPTSESMNAK